MRSRSARTSAISARRSGPPRRPIPEGGTVVYDIRAGNDSLTFAVHALTGAVVVGARLNAATTPSYTLTIRASVLEGGPSATTTVTVTVTSAG